MLLALNLSSAAFAQQTPHEAEKISIVTDVLECKGDVFCVDNMRVTCNARKAAANSLFDKVAADPLSNVRREDLKVEVTLRRNGKDKEQNNVDVKRVECVLEVSSMDRFWLFRETLSAKTRDIAECRTKMEGNLESKHVVFQELIEKKNVFLQRSCRVYLLELVNKS
jgi:hypothetical protein